MKSSDRTTSVFGARLKRARQRAELSQKGLADQLGADQSTISRVEGGRKPRGKLEKQLTSFVERVERQPAASIDEIAEAIADSPEFKALIARIASAL